MSTGVHSLFPLRHRIFPALLLCVILLCAASGCASRVATDTIRSGLSSGNLDSLEKNLEETHQSFGEFATALNLARVYQMDGRWADSIRAYNDALVLLEDYESRAVVNIRALLAGAGTVFFSRGAGEYYGVGYERSLLHTFNALNYLMLGDFSGAAVEMRRMDKRQEIWLEESQARIEKYLESKSELDSPSQLPSGYSMRDILRREDVRTLLNNYQDPFSYALGAVLFRLAADSQAAAVSMRRAIALDDGARQLFADAWPGPAPKRAKADERVDPVVPPLPLPHLPALPRPNGKNAPGKATEAAAQEVTLIAFTGISPALRVENVRIWFPAIGQVLIDLPSYAKPVTGVKPEVFAGNGQVPLSLYPLLRTDLLAYRTLWDEVRMEAAFATSRALARAGVSAAAYAAARSNEDTREYAPLFAAVAGFIMDFFASSMSESVRNWETLPNTGYLALSSVPRGSDITIAAGNCRTSLHLPPDARGVIIMVTELSTANLKVHHVTY